MVGRENTNRSNRIDYVAVDKIQKKVLLIELKTDQKSVRERQINYLIHARNQGINNLMKSFNQIKEHSISKSKYAAFEKELNDLHWNIPEIASSYTTEIIFIAPKKEGLIEEFNVITFGKIAGILEIKDDPVAQRFAQSLIRWQ